MQFGVHLPLIGFRDGSFTRSRLVAVAEAASRLGYEAMAANDHLVFRRPWLDGPTALAAVLEASGDLDLYTTVGLPVVRGPVPFAKAAAALDLLSGGRLVVGIGPGSSPRDYEIAGIDFGERWTRLDEATLALRALLARHDDPFAGRFYATEGFDLEPYSPRANGPPIWIGSWGSDAGLRRVARLADGWLASAYNTTPALFAGARATLRRQLEECGRDSETFPNALATMLLFVADTDREVQRVLADDVAPALGRAPEELEDRLLVATPEAVVERVRAYEQAGVERLFVWPVLDEVGQLEAFAELAGLRRNDGTE